MSMVQQRPEPPKLTAETLAQHSGEASAKIGVNDSQQDVDQTLNATRNSNSLDDIEPVETFPETVMDAEFERADDEKQADEADNQQNSVRGEQEDTVNNDDTENDISRDQQSYNADQN